MGLVPRPTFPAPVTGGGFFPERGGREKDRERTIDWQPRRGERESERERKREKESYWQPTGPDSLHRRGDPADRPRAIGFGIPCFR